jgi:hypothetical protein
MTWTDRYHYSTPMHREIIARRSDGTEILVSYHPIRQAWEDEEGNVVQWDVWKEKE